MKQLKIRHAARRFCVSVGTLLVAANAWAATWYVNGTSGADGNSDRADTSAKATIQAAIDAASAGDTILVAPGTYDAIDTQGKNITIRSTDGAEKTKIVARTGRRLGPDNSITAALLISNETGGQIGDAENEGGPFRYDVADEWKTWTPADLPCSTLEGFSVELNGKVDDVGIVGGRIKNCRLACDERANRFVPVQVAVMENCLITAGDLGVWIDEDGKEDGDVEVLSDCILRNCTVYTGSMLCSSQMANTIVYGRNGKVYLDEGKNRPTLANCIFYGVKKASGRAGVKVSDPKFVDAANGDFRLTKGSPCIDRGGVPYGSVDLAGNPRVINGKVDVGCYEYQGDASPDPDDPSPVEPKPFTVTFDANGGTASAASASYAKGEALGDLPAASRDGYAFAGWFTKPNGGTRATSATKVTRSVTYYARWTEIVVPVAGSERLAATFDGLSKRTFGGLALDADGRMAGLAQLATAKAAKDGSVSVKGFVMLADGKKQAVKAAKGTVQDGLLTVRTTVGKLGALDVTFGGDGFVGRLGGLSVESADVGEDTGILRGTIRLSYLDAKTGAVKTRQVTLTGLTDDGEATGTLSAKGKSPQTFQAVVE